MEFKATKEITIHTDDKNNLNCSLICGYLAYIPLSDNHACKMYHRILDKHENCNIIRCIECVADFGSEGVTE